jgi:hypothetical protein
MYSQEHKNLLHNIKKITTSYSKTRIIFKTLNHSEFLRKNGSQELEVQQG